MYFLIFLGADISFRAFASYLKSGRTPVSGSRLMRALLTKRQNLHKRNHKGFTLIELMMVILVIAILLAVLVPTLFGARSKANTSAAQQDLNQAVNAVATAFTYSNGFAAANGSVLSSTVVASSITSNEPSITWTVGTVPSAGTSDIGVWFEGGTGAALYQSILLEVWNPNNGGSCNYALYIGSTQSALISTTGPFTHPGQYYANGPAGTACSSPGTGDEYSGSLGTTIGGYTWSQTLTSIS